jgi:hypothetical protein
MGDSDITGLIAPPISKKPNEKIFKQFHACVVLISSFISVGEISIN